MTEERIVPVELSLKVDATWIDGPWLDAEFVCFFWLHPDVGAQVSSDNLSLGRLDHVPFVMDG